MKKCLIDIYSPNHFYEVLGKLFSLGYVYSSNRYKSIEDICRYYPVSHSCVEFITLHNDPICKMMVRGDNYYMYLDKSNFKNITIDEFIEKKLYQDEKV